MCRLQEHGQREENRKEDRDMRTEPNSEMFHTWVKEAVSGHRGAKKAQRATTRKSQLVTLQGRLKPLSRTAVWKGLRNPLEKVS